MDPTQRPSHFRGNGANRGNICRVGCQQGPPDGRRTSSPNRCRDFGPAHFGESPNCVLLAEHAQSLLDAGLHRATVSLDTLRSHRFKALTRKDSLDKVLEGIDAARQVGLGSLKIDTVVLRGFNEDEIVDLIEFGKRVGAEVRFIEYMDVGGATRWSMEQVVSKDEILEVLRTRYGSTAPLEEHRWAPAQRHVLPDGTVFARHNGSSLVMGISSCAIVQPRTIKSTLWTGRLARPAPIAQTLYPAHNSTSHCIHFLGGPSGRTAG